MGPPRMAPAAPLVLGEDRPWGQFIVRQNVRKGSGEFARLLLRTRTRSNIGGVIDS
jgi:hypothetical protein